MIAGSEIRTITGIKATWLFPRNYKREAVMFGTLSGNIMGIGYFLIFQILGIFLSFMFFKKENLPGAKNGFILLMGSVLGSFSLQWLPVIYAFFLDFTVIAHILALITMLTLTAAAYFAIGRQILPAGAGLMARVKKWFTDDPVLFLLLPLYLFVVITLLHHTISYVDGAMHSGQSTYGDMNMHLGFITSIARQHTFPPEYSLLPGTKLAYPFLSDSISSSLYLFGSSLRIAYLLPMFAALLQVFFGAYFTIRKLLRGADGSCRGKSILAFALFFLNGGFGFAYFLNKGFYNENFTRIFTAFYETPTNYVTENIQWHNVICDMLIPQRATLFGWAILFPVLALLLHAREHKNMRCFVLSGILAGGLVLIHTHSFLALGVCCGIFLLQDILAEREETRRLPLLGRFGAVVLFLLAMCLIRNRQQSENPLSANAILTIGLALAGLFIGVLVYFLVHAKDRKPLLLWGVFLGVVLVLALPQLFGFTFQQAQGEQFVRGSFNWANSADSGDGYLMFYIKNLGIMFFLTLAMLVFGTKKQCKIALPGIAIWLMSEFILFQPNPYDNNKLLLVAYFFFCAAVSDFVWDTLSAGEKDRRVILSMTAFLGVFAALLTMGREYVSDYELYDASYVSLCEWVEDNTEPSDIFLTNNNHNNAVASLTGRNIVCGSGTFLYYHGLNYAQNEADVKTMYEDPAKRPELLEKYHVSYIVVGAYEMNNYAIPDLDAMRRDYKTVYDENGVVVLKITR